MRIIAGSLGGRLFGSPHGHRTHPMSEKVRGGLFNTLGDISSMKVLDVYAGSGALGFEALSRGALHVTAIESDRNAQRTIAENAAALGLSGSFKLVRAGAGGWLTTTESDGIRFGLILADPPYDDLQQQLLPRLSARLKSDGIMVLSWPGGADIPEIDGLVLRSNKSYGDAQLVYYQRS